MLNFTELILLLTLLILIFWQCMFRLYSRAAL
ncbi:MAG: cytochrome c oxidase subunit 2A [Sporolactobacillus sp.]